MKNTIAKIALLFSVLAVVSCQKDELALTEPTEEVMAQNIPSGKLISATKVSESPAADYVNRYITNMDPKTTELFKLNVFGTDIVKFDIVTYRIKYTSTTHYRGKDRPIVLSGDVSFLTDGKGLITKRYLESVTLFNTMFNVTQFDLEYWKETFMLDIRTIYNALIVYPMYQGGPDSDLIYPVSGEFIIKGKQAIDCELAALEFIETLDNVEMMPGYYTENIGVSNGGGPALAVQYLLENDRDYKQVASKINLLSTYCGAGNYSCQSLMSTLLTMSDEGYAATMRYPGYLSIVAGTYMTWKYEHFMNDEDHYCLSDYFSKNFFSISIDDADVLPTDYRKHLNPLTYWDLDFSYLPPAKRPCLSEKNPLAIFLNNSADLFIYWYGSEIYSIVNSNIIDPQTNNFDLDNASVKALYRAFEHNEVINSGWTPKTPLRFVHSYDDDFLTYKTTQAVYDNLSNNGKNPLVKMDMQEGLDHIDSAIQCMVDILLHKHPYSCKSNITADDLGISFFD